MKNRFKEPVTKQLVRNLFLIDGFGALISAIMLGTVLVEFQPHFGRLISTLYFLAVLPCVFAVYDFYCSFVVKNELGAALKRIAFANLGYCCLSLRMAIYHSEFLPLW